MTRVIALGEQTRVEGLALGGADVVAAATDDDVRRAWHALDDDVAVVVLTPAAARALAGSGGRPRILAVVMPE